MKSIARFLCRLSLLFPLYTFAAQPDCPVIGIEPTTLARASINDAYTATVTQTGSTEATFAVSAGNLPAGLTLAADGTFSGAPTQTGDYLFTATATDTASGCSGSRVYGLSVIAINHAPTFTTGGNPLVREDAGAQTVDGWAANISAGNGDTGQALTFAVTSNNNAALFSTPPAVDAATGNLTYTPAPNVNGTATLTLVLRDDGGTDNGGVDTSTAQAFAITVTAVNDAPGFTAGPNQSVPEDSAPQSIAGWASAISPGPANETGQSITFVAGNDNPALFSAGPAVASDGTLTYTPAANASGTAAVTVIAHDDGGTVDGGSDASGAQIFTITVVPVDDSPVAVDDAATVDQDSGDNAIDVLANDTDIDGGPKLVESVTQPANGTVAVTGGGTGVTYTPDAGYSNDPPTVPADTFTYTLEGGSTGNVAMTVTPVSAGIDVGAYTTNGTCGILNVLGPGFLLTAGPTTALPVGTSILINVTGVANAGVFSVTGGTASVTVLSATSRRITLTAPLAAGQAMAMRTTLSTTVPWTMTGATTLPTGYIAPDGKPNGSVNATLILCSAT